MYYLEARNIVKQYASHKALDNVTIQVPENSIYGLLLFRGYLRFIYQKFQYF